MSTMKIFILLFIGFSTLNAQTLFDDISRDYKYNDDIGKIDLSGSLIEISGNDGQSGIKLDQVQGLFFDKDRRLESAELSKIQKQIKRSRFEYLIKIGDRGKKIDVYGLDDGDYFKEMFLIYRGEELDILLGVSGEIRLEDLDHLDLDFDELEDYIKT